MREIKVIIADADDRFTRDITAAMCRNRNIKIVGHCGDGRKLLSLINEYKPDAVLTELVLRDIDGISVMKTICGAENHPAFIVCTDFYNELCIRRACRYGASAFLCKPVCPESVEDAIIECCSMEKGGISSGYIPEENSCSKGNEVADRLISMGIVQSSDGFRYLRDAVELVRRKPEMISSMTKQLYPEIARMNSTTPSCAERNIRTAIQRAYSTAGFNINGHKPTNREMIAYLANCETA